MVGRSVLIGTLRLASPLVDFQLTPNDMYSGDVEHWVVFGRDCCLDSRPSFVR